MLRSRVAVGVLIAGLGAVVVPAMAANVAQAATSSPTMADVAQHSSPGDCWSAIGGKVYDLTSWITQHPGGQSAIARLCGRDGTASFNGAHRGQSGPSQQLAAMLVGPLAGATNASPTSQAPGTYTASQVRQHRGRSDCWVVVDGVVYNLTSWIAQHPGGQRSILRLCGRDGTALFTRIHGSSAAAATALAPLKIGTVVVASSGRPARPTQGDDDSNEVGEHQRPEQGRYEHGGDDDD